ncbi:hypothetical protein [Bifidobacterium pullorum]|uniref:hypothetical protein n=1 Tax=Bifidobacterium pullorum TaxID=78448 RepID=UPI00320B7CF8
MTGEPQLMNEEEFWQSSAQRQYIRGYARYTRTSPDAVLGATLARVATVAPPNVVTPALVGAYPSGLAVYVAVVGNSGDGKGLAEGVARKLVPDLLDVGETLPVSGEGLATLFAGRRPLPGNDGENRSRGTELYCVNQRALLSVPEIGSLGATMGRTGSTLEPVLLSAWSGEPLGGQNVDENKRLRVPAYGYRLNLITGVQPANAGILADRDGSGLPQRFLWCTTRDLGAPNTRPPQPTGTFTFKTDRLKELQPTSLTLNVLYSAGARERMPLLENGGDPYPLHVMRYPDEVYEAADRDRVMALHDQRPDGMNRHSLLLTIRVAGLLAILEQRDDLLAVTLDDWKAAQWLVRHSIGTRERCISEGRRMCNRKRADRIADGIESKTLGQQMAEERREREQQRRLQRCVDWIPGYLQDKDPNRVGVPVGTLRNDLTKADRPYLDKAIDVLLQSGVIEKRQGERGGKRYALADM